MATLTGSSKKISIDPGKISAWIGLISDTMGLLVGIVTSTNSVYGPIDTIFIYIFWLSISLYIAAGILLTLTMGAMSVFGEKSIDKLYPIGFVLVGILILVIVVPWGIGKGTTVVQSIELGYFALVMYRFVGVCLLLLTAYLVNKFMLKPRNKTQGDSG